MLRARTDDPFRPDHHRDGSSYSPRVEILHQLIFGRGVGGVNNRCPPIRCQLVQANDARMSDTRLSDRVLEGPASQPLRLD